MYSQKKIGNKAEKDFAKLMFNRGWWVHIFADKVTGQPFDIVMAKNNTAWFLDVKHVKDKDYLLHSRIEENQKNAFTMLMNRGSSNCGFAVKFSEFGWYFLRYRDINFNRKLTPRDKMKRIGFK